MLGKGILPLFVHFVLYLKHPYGTPFAKYLPKKSHKKVYKKKEKCLNVLSPTLKLIAVHFSFIAGLGEFFPIW